MLTQCPSCNTLFRISAAILKMGHGQVRCGSCRTQFDALDSLQDEDPIAEANASTSPASSASVVNPNNALAMEQPAQSNSIATDIEREAQSAGESENEQRDDALAADVQEQEDEMLVEFDDAIEIELSGDDSVNEMEEELLRSLDGGQRNDEEEESTDANAELNFNSSSFAANDLASTTDAESESPSNDADRTSESDEANDATKAKDRKWLRRSTFTKNNDQSIATELEALGAEKATRPSHTRMWTIASIVLVIAWMAQVVHHYRDDLVRSASIGSLVTRVYHALGLTLTPRWDLAAYELQQWGVISDPKTPESLRVRASVTNRAQFSQPYPLIRLELQDRWGAPVAMRVFDSEEYLPEKSNANRLLSPKQRANAEIVIADPGADAVGFQIHACLRYEQNVLCSDE